MASPDELVARARRHYERRAKVSRRTAQLAVRAWGKLNPDDISGSYVRGVGQALADATTAGQLEAAADAAPYVADVAAGWGVAGPVGGLDVAQLAGYAANGADLVQLFRGPVVAAKLRIAQGDTPERALAAQAVSVARIAGNEASQAGVNADTLAVTATPGLDGHVRVANLPACGRCVVLAGRFYRWSEGFRRHPLCDCTMLPAPRRDPLPRIVAPPEPRTVFDRMSFDEQNRSFGIAQAQAIRDGADVGQVVNAWRGTYTFELEGVRRRATLEGTDIRQGRAGRQMAVADGQLFRSDGSFRLARMAERTERPRLTVADIYREAGPNRERAIELLRENGYLRDAWRSDFRRTTESLYRDFGQKYKSTRWHHAAPRPPEVPAPDVPEVPAYVAAVNGARAKLTPGQLGRTGADPAVVTQWEQELAALRERHAKAVADNLALEAEARAIRVELGQYPTGAADYHLGDPLNAEKVLAWARTGKDRPAWVDRLIETHDLVEADVDKLRRYLIVASDQRKAWSDVLFWNGRVKSGQRELDAALSGGWDAAPDGAPGAAADAQLDVVLGAGRELRLELERRLEVALADVRSLDPAEVKATQLELSELTSQHYKSTAVMMNHPTYRRWMAETNGLPSHWQTLDVGNLHPTLAGDPQFVELLRERQAIAQRREQLRELWHGQGDVEKRRKAIVRDEARKLIAELRPMGERKTLRYAGKPNAAIKEAIEHSSEYYPAEWLAKMAGYKPLRLGKTKRGFCRNDHDEVLIKLSYPESNLGTFGYAYDHVAVHELGHYAENAVPDLRAAEWLFYWRRTSSVDAATGKRMLDPEKAHAVGEYAREDDFRYWYSGKTYGSVRPDGRNFELLTTAMESLFGGSMYLEGKGKAGHLGDDSYVEWLIGVLAVLG